MGRRVVPSFLIAAILLTTAAAHGSPPDKVEAPEQAIRPGFPVWTGSVILDANTTTVPMKVSPFSVVPACFGFDSNVVVTMGGPGTACFTATTTGAIGSQTTTEGSYFNDTTIAEKDGNGMCIVFPAAGIWTGRPSKFWSQRDGVQGYRTSPGRRTGICSGPQATILDREVNPPCRVASNVGVDADCTDAGVTLGTCSASDNTTSLQNRRANSCLFLVGRAVNASTRMTATIEH